MISAKENRRRVQDLQRRENLQRLHGYVYILSNSHFPGVVKQSFSKNDDIKSNQLNSSIPPGFPVWAVRFKKRVYKAQYIGSQFKRINSEVRRENSEYFNMNVDDAIASLDSIKEG